MFPQPCYMPLWQRSQRHAFIMDGHVCVLLWNVGSLWAEPLLSVIVEPRFPALYLCNCKHLIHDDVIKLTNRTFLSSAAFHPEDG